jgi:hypothetical protein
MNLDKLTIDISYPQKIEIIIDFLVDVLGTYHGLDNLDETWDENIMPVIKQSIMDSGGYLMKSVLEIVKKQHKDVLSCKISIISKPPSIHLKNIIYQLTKVNLQRSICISRVYENGNAVILYLDYDFMDK